jgi:glycosyltransferase involved in cell wall biosynthesis
MLKADAIITISNFSKAEISGALDYPAEKITAIYLGVDHHRYKPLHADEGVRDKYRLPAGKKIVLYVGAEQPRKNIPTLIKAFAEVKKDREDIVFLKVGRPQWRNARRDLLALIEQLHIQNDVIFVDYVPEEDLPGIYNIADLFVFPSIYEGFGLPPLEAMACGCPAITSNAASLPEVVGEAGLMVEPHDVIGLANAMKEVLGSRQRREEMIAKGLKQAGKFNWERTARETEELYHEVHAKAELENTLYDL